MVVRFREKICGGPGIGQRLETLNAGQVAGGELAERKTNYACIRMK
jgi:hypothetical protein